MAISGPIGGLNRIVGCLFKRLICWAVFAQTGGAGLRPVMGPQRAAPAGPVISEYSLGGRCRRTL